MSANESRATFQASRETLTRLSNNTDDLQRVEPLYWMDGSEGKKHTCFSSLAREGRFYREAVLVRPTRFFPKMFVFFFRNTNKKSIGAGVAVPNKSGKYSINRSSMAKQVYAAFVR